MFVLNYPERSLFGRKIISLRCELDMNPKIDRKSYDKTGFGT